MIGNGVNIFVHFSWNPFFDFEPDYVIRKTRKWRFQWCIVRTEIFLAFHARVEYISVKTVISVYRRRAAMTPQSIYRLFTDGRKSKYHMISPVHSVHLGDIIKGSGTMSPAQTASILSSENGPHERTASFVLQLYRTPHRPTTQYIWTS